MSAISTSLITSPFPDSVELVEKIEASDEDFFVAAKGRITAAPEMWITKTHAVENSLPYLGVWSSGNIAHAAANGFFHSYDKETAQSAASALVVLGVLIDVLGAQSSLVNVTLRAKLLQTFRELVDAANNKETTNFELAEIVTQCANVLHQAEGTMGQIEAWAKVGTDAVAGIHQLIQQVNTWVRMASFRLGGEKLSQFFELEDDQTTIKNIRSAGELKKFLASKSPIDPNDPEFAKAVKQQNDHFSASADWSIASSSVGVVTAVANIVRSISEWRRITKANIAIGARIKNLDEGIDALGDKAGVQLLTTVKTIDQHKRTANKAARVGQVMRFLNGLWGLISKIALLAGAVIAPWVSPVIGGGVLLVYLIKGWIQLHYTRKARRVENRLSNTFKILSKWGSRKYEQFLNSGLVRDLKKLVTSGEDLWHMLKAMKRLPLFADVMVQYQRASSAKERLPILKRVLDIFRSSPPDIVEKQLAADGIASHQAFSARISAATLADTSESEAEFPSEYAQDDRSWEVDEAQETEGGKSTTPLVLNAQEEAVFQTFLNGTLEKAIASLLGKLPGWRRNSGDPAIVRPMAIEAIKATVGDTHVTNEVLAVLEGLVENKKTLNKNWYDIFRPLVQSKTWSLTAHAKDCERALETQSPTKLATTTLAAALTGNNAEAIAQCRFQEDPAERYALAERLKASNASELSNLVNAIESPSGKELGEMAKRLGANFPNTLKTALMLFGHPTAVAGAMVVTIIGPEKQATAICAADWRNALAVMTYKQLNATFQDKDVLHRVRHYLSEENQSSETFMERTLVIKPASAEDPRLQTYMDAIVAGKIPFGEIPGWLLSPELSKALNHKAPKSDCADAFREDLNLHFLNGGKQGIPKSLHWPKSSWYGSDDNTVKLQLSRSFRTMLGIETDGTNINAAEMFKAAQLHVTWKKKDPLISDIEKAVKKGGLHAAVMLYRHTGLRGIPLLKDTDAKLFKDAKTQKDFSDICKRLIERRVDESKDITVIKHVGESSSLNTTTVEVRPRIGMLAENDNNKDERPIPVDRANQLEVIIENEEKKEESFEDSANEIQFKRKPEQARRQTPSIEELRKSVQSLRIDALFDRQSVMPSRPAERDHTTVVDVDA